MSAFVWGIGAGQWHRCCLRRLQHDDADRRARLSTYLSHFLTIGLLMKIGGKLWLVENLGEEGSVALFIAASLLIGSLVHVALERPVLAVIRDEHLATSKFQIQWLPIQAVLRGERLSAEHLREQLRRVWRWASTPIGR
jgi:hypothetical protein